MERKNYIQPVIGYAEVDTALMQAISQNTEDAPVVDDGEELGTNSSSIWDCEPVNDGDGMME
ncbi:MAG: hypothetical protein IKT00_00590 [Prevotella sp.]|nr:hypothetical protein [Prevotella sp.]